MKFSIRRMLSGGGLPPFTYYQPVMTNDASTPSSAAANPLAATTTKSSTDSTKGQVTDKDLLEMLGKIDGLPSDMTAILSSMQEMYALPTSLSGDSSLSASTLSSRYIAALNQVKVATFNKKEYDKAYNIVNNNGGLNEVAITDQGKIVVVDAKGNVLDITIDTYNKNKDKYEALSNSKLLDLRAQSKNYAMDNTLLSVVSNGVGMSAVNNFILSLLTGLGSSDTSITGYSKIGSIGQGLTIVEGSKLLKKLTDEGYDLAGGGANVLEGLYKAGKITKTLVNQAKATLEYLFQALPDNMKTLLEFKTGSKANAQKAIISFVSGKLSDEIKVDADMIADANGNKPGTKGSSSGSGEGGDESKQASNLYSDIITGTGGTATTFTLKDADGRVMKINGVSYPNLSLDPSHQVTEGSVSELMQSFNSVYKGGNYAVTFGDLALTSNDMDNISFMNDGLAMRTILPVKQNEKGLIVPDLDFAKTHSDLVDLINKKGMKDPEVLKKMKEAGLVSSFTGLPDTNKFSAFLCVNGLGTDRNIKNNAFASEVKGDNLDLMIDKFENSLYAKKGSEGSDEGKEHKFNFDRESIGPWDWFGLHDTLYQGTIFIPITENINQGLQGGGTDLKMSQEKAYEADYQAYQNEQEQSLSSLVAKKSSSNVLGL